jgi:hypothetical protein
MGVGRWEDPPSALQELREAKTKTYAQQRVQVDLGVTEADIDAMLSSVRSSLPRPSTNNAIYSTPFNHATELPNIAGREYSADAQEVQGDIEQDTNYGAVTATESRFQPSKPFADSRMSRAAMWMGVMFACVFLASYTLSENIHSSDASSPRQINAQQLTSKHIIRAGGKTLLHSHKSAALYKAAADLVARRAKSSESHAAAAARAAVASGHPIPHPVLHPALHTAHKVSSAERSNDSGDSTKSAIMRAEEKRMAKQMEESNDRFVDAMVKSGA